MRASAELSRVAAATRLEAERLNAYAVALRGQWSEVQETDFGGLAAVAGLRKLEELGRVLGQPVVALDAAADLLEAFATARERIEKLQDAAIALLNFSFDAGPLRGEITALLHALNGLGTAMDWSCAAGLKALCTPDYDAPRTRFSERGDLPVDAIHELEMLTASAEVKKLVAHNPNLRLLETPGGGVVAAVGDIESADAIATFVAGVNSADPASWQGQVDSTRTVAAAMGSKTAGVVWLGYRAPDGVFRGMQKAPAGAGAEDLVRFQRGLGERYPTKQLTVVGHSYGSVVAAQAARRDRDGLSAGSLRADNLVLLGSPGAGEGVVHRQALRLEAKEGTEARVFAATTQGDPISLVTDPVAGVHGPDPASPLFGAQPWPSNDMGDHGSYFRDERFLKGFREVRKEN